MGDKTASPLPMVPEMLLFRVAALVVRVAAFFLENLETCRRNKRRSGGGSRREEQKVMGESYELSLLAENLCVAGSC